MPTFTTIALENLLEYRNSAKNSNSSTLKSTQQQENDEHKSKSTERKRLNHIYISPALYTTPEPTSILDYSSSGSTSPSPYVFNRKGRGGGKSANRIIDGFEVQSTAVNEGEVSFLEEGVESESCLVIEGGDVDDDDADFVDPRCDSLSVVSSSELNDSGRLGFENMSLVSNQIGEFYDAIEDFSSDGSMLSVASCNRNIESELHTAKLSLLEEVEKRKTAEYHLATMCSHWQRVGRILLSQTDLAPSSNDGFDITAVKQFSEEIIVTRFVDKAMGMAEAQAEAELAADLIIGSKDKEISRLRDRMQYYEAMIHEMSQKNLESMEVARRQRDRKRGQRKWLWSGIGISIVIGASVIAYSYAPQQSKAVGDTQQDAGYD